MNAAIRLAAAHGRGKVQIKLELILGQLVGAGIDVRDDRVCSGLFFREREVCAYRLLLCPVFG